MAESVPSSTVRVTVRYFAAARAAAGVTEETVPVAAVPAAAGKPFAVTDVGTVIMELAARHGDALARVLARSSYLLDETAVHGPRTPVQAHQVLDVLPPFAGG
ncbi:MAG TPA: MoaD/ThiS family protein [Nakamurella sp.]